MKCAIYPIAERCIHALRENNNPEIWMREINQWFIEIATAINKLTPFIIAILGFECDYF